VKVFDACPSQAEITAMGTSCRCISVPHVCRASWNRMGFRVRGDAVDELGDVAHDVALAHLVPSSAAVGAQSVEHEVEQAFGLLALFGLARCECDACEAREHVCGADV
jgi:hypothetical protein